MMERMGLPASLPEDMPPPSVELTLMALFVGTHLRVLKPKQRKAFMKTMLLTMEEFHSLANVIRIRDRAFDAEVARTRLQATAWVRAMAGAYFLADSERE